MGDMRVLDTDNLMEGTRIASVDFKMPDKDASAEARGEFVRWMIESRCFTVEELLEFKGLDADESGSASIRVHPKASSVDAIVFEPNVTDGGDGGWGRRLAEFEGGKKAFVRQEASGKNKYKRSELNKAMVKNEAKSKKKARQQYAVH